MATVLVVDLLLGGSVLGIAGLFKARKLPQFTMLDLLGRTALIALALGLCVLPTRFRLNTAGDRKTTFFPCLGTLVLRRPSVQIVMQCST